MTSFDRLKATLPAADKVVPYMEAHGIQTRKLFAGNLTNTDRIMKDTIWIGVYPGMADEMIDYMAKALINVMAQ